MNIWIGKSRTSHKDYANGVLWISLNGNDLKSNIQYLNRSDEGGAEAKRKKQLKAENHVRRGYKIYGYVIRAT